MRAWGDVIAGLMCGLGGNRRVSDTTLAVLRSSGNPRGTRRQAGRDSGPRATVAREMWTVACLLVALAATPTPVSGTAPQADRSATSNEEALRRYAQARLLEERGASAEAMAEYYRILVVDPDSKVVALRLSELAGQIGDAGRSLELAERVLKSDPESARALWLRGSARFNLNQRQAGLADLVHAVELDSTNTEYSRS